ncbi:hypothetical protein [Oceanobacillus saliphilus]|uniref:hypothetical protein n=1 Tax=Oceanobacillus saliphilus TaxID=2925834 RepID=UPI00201DA799|nr:hypothetical protein [Oceanobacillus saliphilus]
MNSSQNNQDQQLLIKQLIRDYLKKNIKEVKKEDLEEDNSFVFLENKTLQIIITFILTHLDNHPFQNLKNVDAEASILEEIFPYMDAMIEENKIAFEEVINILKERS